ncbi:hypothetical protein KR51_00014150 [Rubidibacter lacunae KORDI 51-2]|uniref:Uncharacterized protein n=1 Tax=Rubidibacter lacunae KORDI 51-2 TaxID=582515 RepID=U5DN77_9CHRO|nr:hypothetical protein [Rubidibacter lacunae]ERN42074.1 hypothetical protein KR51_00014150 [Rubidibacter lacunae KORDI 51-2]
MKVLLPIQVATFGLSLLSSTVVMMDPAPVLAQVRQPLRTQNHQLVNPTPPPEPEIGDFVNLPDDGSTEDFYCGGQNRVPCDKIFKAYCAKVANGHYKDLPSGHGACITPGGWNP